MEEILARQVATGLQPMVVAQQSHEGVEFLIGLDGFGRDSVLQGMLYFAASLPIAFAGLFSAVHQSKCAVAGIGTISKKPDQFGKAIILPAMVETYAILALLISILAIFGIAGMQ